MWALVSLCLLPKYQEKISVLSNIVLSLITQLCVGVFGAKVLSILHIVINLKSMGIIWLGFGGVITIMILNKKKIQSMYIDKCVVFGCIILTGFIGLIFFQIFTKDFNWIYRTTDPSSHLIMAQNVVRTGKIEGMYFTALYNGLMLEIFQPFIDEINLYKIYIVSDTLFNYLNLLMCYIWIIVMCKSKKMKWICPIFAMGYFIGWPLSSYAYYGFTYFGVGITIYAYALYLLFAEVKYKQIELKWLYICIALGIFSLTVCYMLFTPVLVATILIYLIIKKRRYLTRSIIIKVILISCVFLSAIFAIVFWGYFGGKISAIFDALRLDGGIHKCLLGDFIFLAPFVTYTLVKEYRKKNLIDIAFYVLLLVIMIAFAMTCMNVMGGYYYYKLYYLLWLLCWLLCIRAVESIYEDNKWILVSMLLPVLMAFTILWSGAEEHMNSTLEAKDVEGLFPIYNSNRQLIFNPDEYIINDRNEVKNLAIYIRNSFDSDEIVPLIYSHRGYHLGRVWYQALMGYDSYDYDNDNLSEILEQIETQYRYFAISSQVVFENEELMKKYKKIYDENDYSIYQIYEDADETEDIR